jgi:hypothetical protein
MSITSLGLSTPLGAAPTPQLVALTNQVASAHTQLTALSETPTPAPPANTAQQLASVLNTLSKFIPGDILTLYLGVEAAIKSGYPIQQTNVIPTEAQRLAQYDFWFCIVFTVVWIVLLRWVSARAANTQFVPPIWPAIAGLLAFAMYACAVDIFWLNPPTLTLPNTVFIAIGVTLVTSVLTMLNKVIGIAFPDQMVS